MGKVAIVTGGTRGIGEAISVALTNAGMTVIAGFSEKVQRAEDFFDRTGIVTERWNVADFDACANACNSITRKFGPIDVLINNAGVTHDAVLSKMNAEAWRQVIDINLGGCFNMAKAVISGMRERQWGRIVNIGSINGQAGQFGQVNYSAAKAGIHGFTKALAIESARYGITVNTVAPGYMNTEMVAAVPAEALKSIKDKIPMGRLGEPEEVARVVEFLCQDASGYITGSTLSINGGLHMY